MHSLREGYRYAACRERGLLQGACLSPAGMVPTYIVRQDLWYRISWFFSPFSSFLHKCYKFINNSVMQVLRTVPTASRLLMNSLRPFHFPANFYRRRLDLLISPLHHPIPPHSPNIINSNNRFAKKSNASFPFRPHLQCTMKAIPRPLTCHFPAVLRRLLPKMLWRR